ncbi:MAG: hypothetical protein HBSAPP04_20860 [Ignavibacteriaceae bacterium]|nr:MAG: hypothetical protein HBSAPP04_20860 [Ignavibacteriaceae bacterium]
MHHHANISNVKPLLQSYTLDGDLIVCIFRCGVTGQKFAAMSHLPTKIDEPVFRGNDESAFSNIRYALTRTFQKVINGRFGSRLYDDEKFFDQRAILEDKVTPPAEDAVNSGIVAAFTSILSHFSWDNEAAGWVALPGNATKVYGFERILAEGKPVSDEEKQFLSKVLLMVAGADDTLKEIEKLFLFDFVFPIPKTVSEITLQGGLTQEECSRIRRFEFKKAVILFAWAIALTDRELDTREADLIVEAGRMLQLDELLVMQLCETAGRFVLVKYLEHLSSGLTDSEKIRSKAREISKILLLNEKEADEVISKYFAD